MTITDLSPYHLAILQYHADRNNTPLADAAAGYLAVQIATTLEPAYLDAQTTQFHAALKDDAVRPALVQSLTPATAVVVTATPTATPVV